MSNFHAGALDSRILRTLALLIGLCILMWTASGWVISGNTTYMALAVIACAVVVMTMSIAKDWRTGLSIFLCWLVVEDTLRKYFGNNLMIFFAKDIILGITYLSMFASPGERTSSRCSSLLSSSGSVFFSPWPWRRHLILTLPAYFLDSWE